VCGRVGAYAEKAAARETRPPAGTFLCAVLGAGVSFALA
jgi:hypothetical protein